MFYVFYEVCGGVEHCEFSVHCDGNALSSLLQHGSWKESKGSAVIFVNTKVTRPPPCIAAAYVFKSRRGYCVLVSYIVSSTKQHDNVYELAPASPPS